MGFMMSARESTALSTFGDTAQKSSTTSASQP